MIINFRKTSKVFLIASIPFFIAYLVWTWNPVEDFVGRWLDFLDPQRQMHLHERLEKKTTNKLVSLLEHGDHMKSGIAATILKNRADKGLFDEMVQKIQTSKSAEVRNYARGIIRWTDQKRAAKFFLDDLKKLPKDSTDYSDTLLVLVNMKEPSAFPYLIDYAKNDHGNRKNSAHLLKEFGDPRALPVLEEMLKQNPGEWDVDEVHSAIDYLTQVKEGKIDPSKSNET